MKTLFKGKVIEVVQEPTRGHEVVLHAGAVGVLAVSGSMRYGPDSKVILCRQFRPAVQSDTWEIVAGTKDVPGEPAAETAVREMHEEIQMHPNQLFPLGDIYPSPGYSSELIELFIGWELAAWNGEKHEVDHHQEFTVREVMRMIRAGEIRDAKTIAALLFWQHSDF